MDELFMVLIIILCVPVVCYRRPSRQEEHEKAVRLLGLTTAAGQRFFEAIHASPNAKLFRWMHKPLTPYFGDANHLSVTQYEINASCWLLR
ncbi:hypothetical protein PHMEG_00015435 [Phytophthora megakarya]|uniref:RxLR effector protein n=1 Tax=Phytophthora megakarya TaxID=4795 RepID=A0A225W3E0_9STRA|nr:hypothetical protein PHMEG_00015435 [Phytophthora megakarya]